MYVTEGDRLVGVITRKTLVREVVAAGRHPRETALGGIAEPPHYTIGPDVPVEDAFRFLEEEDAERVPVVDADERLVGVLSRSVLQRRLAEDEEPEPQSMRSPRTRATPTGPTTARSRFRPPPSARSPRSRLVRSAGGRDGGARHQAQAGVRPGRRGRRLSRPHRQALAAGDEPRGRAHRRVGEGARAEHGAAEAGSDTTRRASRSSGAGTRAELEPCEAKLRELRDRARRGRVTIVFGARDVEHSNAAVLAEVLRAAA